MGHFDALCDLSEAERVPHLDRLSNEEPELCAALLRLLHHDAAGGGELDRRPPSGTLAPLLADADEPAPLAAAPPVPPSPLIAERYEMKQPLGSGGTGAVFLAFDRETQGPVAIKFLRRQPTEEPRDVGRFRREFRAVSRLSHPGCLKVFAEGMHGDQRYIVMEYAPGGDLSRLAGALDYVHGQGIVHRDPNPQGVAVAGCVAPVIGGNFGGFETPRCTGSSGCQAAN